MRGLTFGLLVGLCGAVAARGEDPPLAEYFRAETAKLAGKPLLGIDSADAWKAKRPELQAKLKGMLGLVPEPPRGDLKVEVRGTVEKPDFVIEKIVYQSIPGLYVTGNVYRPKSVEKDKKLPAILYVCGHSRVEKDGVIYGSKAHYQHHAAWFAANGYVCLVVDTLELGEVPGEHHGIYNKGRWWWISRGYTPAGIEAWNGVRGIDYLVSRPDVDASKIGVTGRSGGGATSWWLGAIDDRIAAVCPVAGVTDLTDHVVDGVVEGHCDCMYFTNTERWDYTMLASLVAPKPMLIENTDKDPIFPEDGVRRIYAQAEKVYGWYDAKDKLSLIVGKGGHVDSEELRHPAFAFFEKWLKGKADAKVAEPDRKVPVEGVRVLNKGETFADAKNGSIDESFIPKAGEPPVPADFDGDSAKNAFQRLKDGWLKRARAEVFGGWPAEGEEVPLNVQERVDVLREGIRVRVYEFTSQDGVRLNVYRFTPPEPLNPTPKFAGSLPVGVLDEASWKADWSVLGDLKSQKTITRAATAEDANSFLPNRSELAALKSDLFLIAPRGVGPTAWPAAKDVHVRRRFWLLGQTLAGMQVWDVRRGLAAIRSLPGLQDRTFDLRGAGEGATIALWAAAFEPAVASLTVWPVVTGPADGPAFLNLDRIVATPQALSLVFPRAVVLKGTPDSADRWKWLSALANNLAKAPFAEDAYLHFR